MADRLMRRTPLFAFAWPWLLLAALPVSAQTALPDPTRPPAAFASDAAASGDSASPLQSVLIPRQGRPSALLGGQWVRLGEEWNGSRLVKVSEGGVVLQGGGTTQRLQLTPDISKIPVKPVKLKHSAGQKAPSKGQP